MPQSSPRPTSTSVLCEGVQLTALKRGWWESDGVAFSSSRKSRKMNKWISYHVCVALQSLFFIEYLNCLCLSDIRFSENACNRHTNQMHAISILMCMWRVTI
jgi:hypothetical protein